MTVDTDEAGTLEVAEQVAEILRLHRAESAVIGAMALAVYGHVRATEDFDLATDTDPFSTLRNVAAALRAEGLQAELLEPDAEDPLGGGISGLGAEVVREAVGGSVEGSSLRVVSLPHLVALKLYAGGAAATRDVVEVLERNRPVDLERLREVCGRFGLDKELEAVLGDLVLDVAPG